MRSPAIYSLRSLTLNQSDLSARLRSVSNNSQVTLSIDEITSDRNSFQLINMATTTLSRYINDHEELTGWRFEPSDEELVSHFLFNKIIGKELSDFEKIFVRDYDLYGDEEPFDIWHKFEGEENQDLFFITPLKNLKKKNDDKGLRYDRKVGGNGGTWHGEDTGREFEVSVTMNNGTKKTLKAIRKRFSYRNSGSDQHSQWIMLEYSLEMSDRYVICRLRKNVRGANGRNKKRGSNAVDAAADDIVEYSANKRMRKTIMQEDALQRVESEFIGENQNQLLEYNPWEVPAECCPSKFTENQINTEEALHSVDANGGELECAFSGQQEATNVVENQNVEAVAEGDYCASSTVGDADISMSRVEDWSSLNVDELMRDLDYDGSELLGTFESNVIEESNNVAVTCSPVEDIRSVEDAEIEAEGDMSSKCVDGFSSELLEMSSFGQQEYDAWELPAECSPSKVIESQINTVDEASGGELESGEQEAGMVENQNVEAIVEGESREGDSKWMSRVEDWKSCIDELMCDLDGTQFSESNGFEGAITSGEEEADLFQPQNGFSFGQQQYDQFWTTMQYY